MVFKLVFHLLKTFLLTITTQIGGVVYLFTILIFLKRNRKFKAVAFIISYSIFSFLILPYLAPFFGRVKIKNTELIQPSSFIYVLANRNNVVAEFDLVLC